MKMVSRAILWGESNFGSCRRFIKRAKRPPFSRIQGAFAVYFSVSLILYHGDGPV